MKLLAFAAAWIAGLLVGLEVNAYLPALVLFSAAAVTLGCLLSRRGLSPWPLLLAVIALTGLIRVELSEGSDPLRPTGGLRPVTVRGLVVSDPEVSGPGVQFTLFCRYGAEGRRPGGE